MFEGFNREVKAGFQSQGAFVGIHLFNNGVVVAALHNDRYVFMVLGSGTHHGRAADINVLYRIFQRAAFACHCLGERIQVYNHHIDRGDTVLFHNSVILTATTKNAAVDFRMQGLHASIHHFRETGVIGNFGHWQTFLR